MKRIMAVKRAEAAYLVGKTYISAADANVVQTFSERFVR